MHVTLKNKVIRVYICRGCVEMGIEVTEFKPLDVRGIVSMLWENLSKTSYEDLIIRYIKGNIKNLDKQGKQEHFNLVRDSRVGVNNVLYLRQGTKIEYTGITTKNLNKYGEIGLDVKYQLEGILYGIGGEETIGLKGTATEYLKLDMLTESTRDYITKEIKENKEEVLEKLNTKVGEYWNGSSVTGESSFSISTLRDDLYVTKDSEQLSEYLIRFSKNFTNLKCKILEGTEDNERKLLDYRELLLDKVINRDKKVEVLNERFNTVLEGILTDESYRILGKKIGETMSGESINEYKLIIDEKVSYLLLPTAVFRLKRGIQHELVVLDVEVVYDILSKNPNKDALDSDYQIDSQIKELLIRVIESMM